MDPCFQRIALIGKPDAELIAQTLPPLYAHLRKLGREVLVEENCARFIDGSPRSFPLEEKGKHCDLAIVIGGDGTLLSAARILAQSSAEALTGEGRPSSASIGASTVTPRMARKATRLASAPAWGWT